MTNIKDIKAGDVMSGKLKHTSPDETVSDVIGLMREYDLEEVPVVKDGEVVGFISDNTFIDRRNLSFSTKIKHVMNPPPEVKKDYSLVKICELLLSSGYRGVPVTSESGKYEGFISRKDISRTIPSINELKKTSVKDYMTPDPETIEEDEHIGKAKSMMDRYDVRVLPVVDQHEKLIGMIGIQDILNKVARPIPREEKNSKGGEIDSPQRDIEVKSVMSESAITISLNSSIHDAAKKMNERGISTLVVTREGEIKGVITQFDLIEMITSFREADQVYVQISGLKGRSDVYDQMYDMIQKCLGKMNKVLDPLVLNVHVVSHQEDGTQAKYSVRLRLSTDFGMYYAKKVDWNMMEALDEGLDSLKKRVFEDKDKKVEERRHPMYEGIIYEER
ncbi:MAG: CBS domain-containing protein [Candidatus Thermoplasmatota archaeon]|nr:CBS domain-containing protein [Candidatus Thermoplasmatota archaeon]